MLTKKLITCAAFCLITSTHATEWLDDLDIAKETAQKENKDILINFSGSDWCGYCIKLDKNVFTKPGIMEKISETFIPVIIDAPQDRSKLSAKARMVNEKLAQNYQVDGFPTLLLCKSDGTEYVRTSFREMNAEEYVSHLLELRQKFHKLDEKLQSAMQETEENRLKALDSILKELKITTLTEERFAEYRNEIVRIGNESKRGKFYGGINNLVQLQSRMDELLNAARAGEIQREEFFQKLKLLADRAEEGESMTGRVLQHALIFAAQIHLNTGTPENGISLLEKAVQASPQTEVAKTIKSQLPSIKAQINTTNKEHNE